jgi:hypothetical protein
MLVGRRIQFPPERLSFCVFNLVVNDRTQILPRVRSVPRKLSRVQRNSYYLRLPHHLQTIVSSIGFSLCVFLFLAAISNRYPGPPDPFSALSFSAPSASLR